MDKRRYDWKKTDQEACTLYLETQAAHIDREVQAFCQAQDPEHVRARCSVSPFQNANTGSINVEVLWSGQGKARDVEFFDAVVREAGILMAELVQGRNLFVKPLTRTESEMAYALKISDFSSFYPET